MYTESLDMLVMMIFFMFVFISLLNYIFMDFIIGKYYKKMMKNTSENDEDKK